VSPDVFHQMLDRLGEFVVPYQRALAGLVANCAQEVEKGQLPLSVEGLRG
jgi:hypothetical protein